MTYSIVARDPQTGQLGIAVQSRFFGAGRIVPTIEAGVGAVASQSFANPDYGPEGMRMLRAGSSAQDALQKLVAEDAGAGLRQAAIVDAQGGVAVHTGAACLPAAGHSIGMQCAAQANLMTRDSVWLAMLAAYERAAGPLAERLLAAMEAAEREGGDLRGKQAGALIIVSGEASTRPVRLIDLRIDDHADPVGEMSRQLAYLRAHQRADQAVAKASAGDLSNALTELDACCEQFPREPEFLTRRALVLLRLGRAGEARQTMERACAIHPGWAEFAWRFANAGIVSIPLERMEGVVAGLRPQPGKRG